MILTGRVPRRSLDDVTCSPATVSLLAAISLAGCSDDEGNTDSGPCPDGGAPLTAVFDLGEDPRTYSSQRRAVVRFLAQNDVELESDDVSRSDGEATFTADSESTGPVRLYVERIADGWIVTSYEACRGVV